MHSRWVFLNKMVPSQVCMSETLLILLQSPNVLPRLFVHISMQLFLLWYLWDNRPLNNHYIILYWYIYCLSCTRIIKRVLGRLTPFLTSFFSFCFHQDIWSTFHGEPSKERSNIVSYHCAAACKRKFNNQWPSFFNCLPQTQRGKKINNTTLLLHQYLMPWIRRGSPLTSMWSRHSLTRNHEREYINSLISWSMFYAKTKGMNSRNNSDTFWPNNR